MLVRRVLTFPPAEVSPNRDDVLRGQGVPPGAAISDRVEALLQVAGDRFAALARPRAVVHPMGRDAVVTVLRGDGFEPEETPAGSIAPRADGLALFAATLGQETSDEIDALFAGGDFALAAMLDSFASEAAEAVVVRLERWFAAEIASRGTLAGAMNCAPTGPPRSAAGGPGRGAPAGAMYGAPTGTRRSATGTGAVVLAYSPGYCGWPVTGQRRLFAALEPADVGITLTSSCLMRPLKSVSGVLVAGPLSLHGLGRGFPCCSACSDPVCRARIERVASEVRHGDPDPHRPVPSER